MTLGIVWPLEQPGFWKSSQNRRPATSFHLGMADFRYWVHLINSIVLIIGSVFIVREAILRLQQPEFSDAKGMIILALLGICVNGFAAYKTSHGRSLNEKVVSWHLLEDVLGWTAVLVVSIFLFFKPNPYLDPILSILITLFILWGVIRRLQETMHLFLQGTPTNLNLEEIKKDLLTIPQIRALHHTHVWSIEGEKNVFSTHVLLEQVNSVEEIQNVKSKIKEVLGKYPLDHYTIETELYEEDCSMQQLSEPDHVH